ncbi:MAG: rRNA maturation RNase YbeY [Candidatus Omnitrophica bacterium]|nr:rRNA maturation RNase YbeY [Candidatus Omnitrophota bacterium]
MNVRLSNEQTRIRLSSAKLRKIAALILRAVGFERAEVAFRFVSDARMKTLNRRFMKSRARTDVLAFSQWEGKPMPAVGAPLLGDVVISVDAARRQAPVYGHSFERELALYMAHGVLHLLGHDDLKPGPRAKMRKEEARILRAVARRVPQTRPTA